MGLLEMFGAGGNPIYQAFDQNRGKITNAFAGMVGAGNDPRQALTGWTQGLQHGVNVDTERALIAKQEAEKQAAAQAETERQASQIEWLKQNAPEYAGLMQNGFIAPTDIGKQLTAKPEPAPDPAAVSEYKFYANQELTAGRAPVSFKEWQKGSGNALGPYQGTGMDAQNWNILLTGDPSSSEYAAAWSQINQPKITYTQGPEGLVPVIQNPNIPSGIRPPSGMGTGQQPSAPSMAGGMQAPNADVAPIGPFGAPSGGGQQPLGGISAGLPIPGTTPKPTEAQFRNQAIGQILLNEIPTVNENFTALADPKGQLLGMLGPLGNPWQSPEYQQAASAVTATVANVLYSLSGASSNPGEVVKQIAVLTPQFGDGPEVIADKLKRFNTYVTAIASQSGDKALIEAVRQATAGLNPASATAPAAAPKMLVYNAATGELE